VNDSTFHWESPRESPIDGDSVSREDAPQFGAVDIVEAFTALRHEWRGQTKETRALAEQIQAAAANLQALESKLLECVADNRPDEPTESKQLAQLIVETDHQLSRAVTAIAHWEAKERDREAADAKAAEHYFAGMNRIARWFARPLLEFLAAQRSTQRPAANDPAIEGLDMVLARLRRRMHEQGIERLDALGQPFDADTMHAIGTVASTEYPSGHVAEQLSPGYRWRGRLLCFADVRVAR
jgi:molecular chaperone GrpE